MSQEQEDHVRNYILPMHWSDRHTTGNDYEQNTFKHQQPEILQKSYSS